MAPARTLVRARASSQWLESSARLPVRELSSGIGAPRGLERPTRCDIRADGAAAGLTHVREAEALDFLRQVCGYLFHAVQAELRTTGTLVEE